MPGRKLFYFFAGVVLAVAPASLLGDDFSLERLRAGEGAFKARRIPEAVDQLRIACFGLLDEPVLLSEGLARLAMAQEAAGRRGDVVATLNRFLEVERRFGVYARSHLDETARAQFQALLLSRLPTEAVAAVPTLSSLVRRPAPTSRKEP
jgi:hypothetical protein